MELKLCKFVKYKDYFTEFFSTKKYGEGTNNTSFNFS